MPLSVDPEQIPRAPVLLVLARHGKSLMNHLKYYQLFLPEEADSALVAHLNDLEIPLMPEGYEQSERLGDILAKGYGYFDVICHSDHLRSRQTARKVLSRLPQGTPHERCQHFFFNERDNGYFFGRKRSEMEAILGKTFVDAHQAYWDRTGWFLARPFGGESIADVASGRAARALEMIHRRFAGKRVLLIGHGTWIRAARVLLEEHRTDTTYAPFAGLGNCGFVTYTRNKHGVLELQQYQYDTEYADPPIPPE
jgi:broad specificity phosphatase PhoE